MLGIHTLHTHTHTCVAVRADDSSETLARSCDLSVSRWSFSLTRVLISRSYGVSGKVRRVCVWWSSGRLNIYFLPHNSVTRLVSLCNHSETHDSEINATHNGSDLVVCKDSETPVTTASSGMVFIWMIAN